MLQTFSSIKISLFGESHGEAIGVVVEGFPAGEVIDKEQLQSFMQRRRSSNACYSTPRIETDEIEFLSGVKNGYLTGAPICAIIKNTNTKSVDYADISNTPRPSHADFVANIKYGGYADTVGGGHFSGRITAALCIAGGIAKQILQRKGVCVGAYITRIGNEESRGYANAEVTYNDISLCHKNQLPTLDSNKIESMLQCIKRASSENDSVGGVIECIVYGAPIGLGGAYFNGLEGRIAQAVYAIPAVKAVEFGAGFGFGSMRASECNDEFCYDGEKVITATNNNGGINGGISNGMNITFKVGVKPTPSISRKQNTVDLQTQKNCVINISGRHDACIVPRAVACVEASACLVILDCMLEENK